MKVTVEFDMPEHLIGAVRQASAKFPAGADTEAELVRDSYIFAMRRVLEGTPLRDSLVASLEEQHSSAKLLTQQASTVVRTVEMALADSLALQRALGSLITKIAGHSPSKLATSDNGNLTSITQ